jgi:hypothetical protein
MASHPNITAQIYDLIDLYTSGDPDICDAVTAADINTGYCWNFSHDVIKKVPGANEVVNPISNAIDLPSTARKDDLYLPTHSWVLYQGRHYDSEAPEGVDYWWQLPIYQNWLLYAFPSIPIPVFLEALLEAHLTYLRYSSSYPEDGDGSDLRYLWMFEPPQTLSEPF